MNKVTKQPSRSRELLDPFAPHLCKELCQCMANVAKHLEGVTIRKVIHVKDKRLNLVVG